MRTRMLSQPDMLQTLPPAAVETVLLELFAPARPPGRGGTGRSGSGHAPLWRQDAIHRAKNMAQMTLSLASLADDPTRCWLPPDVTKQARCLSRAYDELGVDDDPRARVPCAALLTDIATRLADIFGRSRRVAVVVDAQPVLLPPDVRRALVLMGSELIINALKYGYPTMVGGTIAVGLAARDDAVELVVEDDGIGRADTYAAGHGGGLLDRLGTVLGATLTRCSGGQGHGFRVTVTVPVDAVRGGGG